jgi:ribonuclease P protein component
MPRFPKVERLRSSGDFKAVFQQCRKVEDPVLALYVQFSERPPGRLFGVSIGRAHGKAHDRNRLKRRLREIYRVEKARFRDGYRIILIPKRTAAQRPFDALRDSFLSLARRSGLFPRTSTGPS